MEAGSGAEESGKLRMKGVRCPGGEEDLVLGWCTREWRRVAVENLGRQGRFGKDEVLQGELIRWCEGKND